jgi:hypothetical protein
MAGWEDLRNRIVMAFQHACWTVALLAVFGAVHWLLKLPGARFVMDDLVLRFVSVADDIAVVFLSVWFIFEMCFDVVKDWAVRNKFIAFAF